MTLPSRWMRRPRTRLLSMVALHEARRRRSPAWWRGYSDARMLLNLRVRLAVLDSRPSGTSDGRKA